MEIPNAIGFNVSRVSIHILLAGRGLKRGYRDTR